jgi:hypothetical protein
MVLADSDRIARVPPYLGNPLARDSVSPTGLSPSLAGLSRPVRLRLPGATVAPLPRPTHVGRFGLFRVRSPLLAESLLFSFPPGTEMFHFPGLASRTYGFGTG